MINDDNNIKDITNNGNENTKLNEDENVVLSDQFQVSFDITESDWEELNNYSEEITNQLKKGYWYSINCVGGKEKKIVESLKKMLKHEDCMEVQQILVCYKEKEVQRGKKKIKRIVNEIPGAIFIKTLMTKDIHRIVRQLENVIGFIGEQRGSSLPPQIISEREIDRLFLKYLIGSEVEDAKQIEINFKVGDYIEVMTGALEGYVGQVLHIEKDTVQVAIDMLGRKVTSQVPIVNVKPVG